MDTNELMKEALAYHAEGGPGKIEIRPTKPDATQYDLSLAYSPGVAAPCLAIADDPAKAYDYTIKGNLVAVITNGTAVLGLGDIGPLAAKPVMEGKCMLFKHFSGINAFDIEIDTTDPEEFIAAVKRIAPTFGGINLEDIKAPECFEIERRLVEELDIPVMHDDQHGTAIIASAALINAMYLSGKRIDEAQIVVNGAGAAAIACARMFLALGARRDQITMCDSRGVVTTRRTDLNPVKREFATSRPVTTLREALVGADVFLGVSTAGVLDADMVRSMAGNPLVMALANPDPEISYDEAKAARPDVIVANGPYRLPQSGEQRAGIPLHLPRRTRRPRPQDQRSDETRRCARTRGAGTRGGSCGAGCRLRRRPARIRSRLPDPETDGPAPARPRRPRRSPRGSRIGRGAAPSRHRINAKTGSLPSGELPVFVFLFLLGRQPLPDQP